MITVGELTFTQQTGTDQHTHKTVEFAQLIIDDDGQRLGYVATNIDTPPINLIVRVSDEDAEEIKRQTEAHLGRPCRGVGMPPKVTTAMLKKISQVLSSSGKPIEEVYQVPVDDITEYEDDDE